MKSKQQTMNATRYFGVDGPRVLTYLAACGLAVGLSTAWALPGKISQKPLFLTLGVQPNVLLLLDDSGSMDMEVLKTGGARVAQPSLNNCERNGFVGNPPCNVDFSPENDGDPDNDEELNLRLCVGHNALAYDPNKTYTPWVGVDKDGNTFKDQDPANAQANPYLGSGSTEPCLIQYDKFWDESPIDGAKSETPVPGLTCDLLAGSNSLNPDGTYEFKGAYYYEWNDANNNGTYEAGECPTDADSRIYVATLGTNAEKVNFANWFSYYRKREFVMKRALTEIIAGSRERVGMATLFQNNGKPHLVTGKQVGVQVKNIDDISRPVDPDAEKNKKDLLDNLLGIDSYMPTPLRRMLDNAGKYFEGTLDNSELFADLKDDPDSAKGHSPILKKKLGGECQQNFAIVMSDGFWNGDLDSSTENEIGNADGDGDTTFDGQSYADTYTDEVTFADIAMHYYERDLMPNLADKVPTVDTVNGEDDNPKQHMVTFAVAFGINGLTTCNPDDRSLAVTAQGWPEVCTDPTFSGTGTGWPEPTSDEIETVDDMRHAAWNGRGAFLSAGDADELIGQLKDAFNDIGSRSATAAAAVSISSTSIQTDSVVYQAGFESDTWSGELTAYKVTTAGLGAEQWKAGEKLVNRDLGNDPRILITFDGTNGVPFRFPADYQNPASGELTEQHLKDLLFKAEHKKGAPWNADTITATERDQNQAYGEAIVGYFRGLRSYDGTKFRNRDNYRLGDIIHSGPQYVAGPDPEAYPDSIETDSYAAWANTTAVKNRKKMVYIGANDGALHAFEDGTGRELFAYYPKIIFAEGNDGGLHLLAEHDYTHKFYVDNTPVVAQAYIGTPQGDTAEWRTVLIGSLRGGGKGLFALDITDPGSITDETQAATNVLWEFTHKDLGFTFGQPTVTKLVNGKWVVIFGSGYNPAGPNAEGDAKLFIVNLEDPSDVTILSTKKGANTKGNCDDCNGMATPAVVDVNGDGIADRAFAGDLLGNMWVFDLTASPFAPAYGTISNPTPLFTAKDKSNELQPITTQPAVTLHLTEKGTDTEPNLMVFFGSGQYLTETDAAAAGTGGQSSITQTFYGLWDGGNAISSRSELVEQVIDPTGTSNNPLTIDSVDYEVRTLTNNNVNYATRKGWFTDMVEAGERIVVSPLLFGELVVYTSMIPQSSQCDGSGTSWLMVQDFFDGSEPDFKAIDVDNNGTWDADDVKDGHNVAGVKSGDIYWQPTIVQSGVGTEGRLFLPRDTGNDNDADTLATQNIQGGANTSVRSSWMHFEFF